MIPSRKKSGVGFVGFDLEGHILYASKNILEILQVQDSDLGNIHDLFSRHSILLDAAVDAVQGKAESYEFSILGKYYLIEMLTHSPLVQDADVVAVFTDITFVKEREDAYTLKLNQQQDLIKELEQFAYVTSHDLSEPLRMVGNFAHLLDNEYAEKLDDDARTYLKFIVNGSQQVQYLVNDLLSYNRACRADLKPQLIQLEDVILLQAYKLRDSIDTKDATVNIESSEGVFADPQWLGEVFHHLLKNAIIHNERTPSIEINVDAVDTQTIITVKDNGIGLDAKHQDAVFQLLKKVDSRPDINGSGIGLAVCKKIISLHGGRIWYESKPKEGTTFSFTLPKVK